MKTFQFFSKKMHYKMVDSSNYFPLMGNISLNKSKSCFYYTFFSFWFINLGVKYRT